MAERPTHRCSPSAAGRVRWGFFRPPSRGTRVRWAGLFASLTAVGILVTALVIWLGRTPPPPPPGDFPAAGLPNAPGLVSVYWLQQLLQYAAQPASQPRPATYEQPQYVVVEASWATLADATDYRRGHVPGAIHVNTDAFETGSPTWRLKSLPELQQVIGDLGIPPQATVIVYSEQLIAAARIWWILSYAGVQDVRLLDGDMRTWRAAGLPIETTIQYRPPVEFVAPGRTEWLIETAELRQRLLPSNSPSPPAATVDAAAPQSPSTLEAGQGRAMEQVPPDNAEQTPLLPATCQLWDVRSWAEYTGARSGYSYLDARGRIPTATWLGDADDSSGVYKRSDGRLQSPSQVYAAWQAQAGWSPTEQADHAAPVVFYCGGGWRSSVAFFYAWLAGIPNLRNYSDGWGGWSTHYQPDPQAYGSTPGYRQVPTGNPVATGLPDDNENAVIVPERTP